MNDSKSKREKKVQYNIRRKRTKSKDADWRKRRIFREAKLRASKNKIAFELEFDDIAWPEVCPVLETPLIYNNNKKGFSNVLPSLDRLVPSKGYVKQNVRVISSRANRIKYNATIEELKHLVEYLEGLR